MRGVGGHNWEKYFIGLFYISEHLGHFKAIQKSYKKKLEIEFGWKVVPPSPCLVKYQTVSRFVFLKASLSTFRF